MKLENLCRLKFKKILTILEPPKFESLSRVLCTKFGALYIVGKKKLFIKISMGMKLKYVEILVAAKKSVKFRRGIREIPKNRSKFTKHVILHLFFLAVQTSFSAV